MFGAVMKLVIVLLFASFAIAESKKILGIYSHPGRSHHNFGSAILNELAKRGHEVTMVSAYPLTKTVPNFTDIYLDGFLQGLDEYDKFYMEMEKSPYYNLAYALQMISYFSNKTFAHPKIQELVKSREHFDLVMMDSFGKDAELYFGNIFKAPIILTASFGTQNFVNYITNNPEPPSYVPGSGTPMTDEMGFWERVQNVAYAWFVFLFIQVNKMQQDKILETYFGKVPSVDELRNNVALVFVNSHPSFESPRPMLPNMISVGGIHVEDSESLPEISILPRETVNEIIRALSKLPQKVLLKWESDSLPVVPGNILMKKWFPQRGILRHPNLKAIVTHGGLMTKIEAIYYGVPMVGIPLFGDQKTNIAHSVSEGIAIQIRPKELSATTLNNALTEIVNNPSYRSNVKVRSEMLRDQPMKPLDVAIYWSEHVMKYGGARHLQNEGMKLYWFQNLLLDVAAFSILIFGVLLWLLIRIYRYVSKLFEGNRASVQEKSKMH